MIDLVLAADDVDAIRRELAGGQDEVCAILYASQTVRGDGRIRLLVREVQFAEVADFSRRGLLEAELYPEFVARVTKRGSREGYALVFCIAIQDLTPQPSRPLTRAASNTSRPFSRIGIRVSRTRLLLSTPAECGLAAWARMREFVCLELARPAKSFPTQRMPQRPPRRCSTARFGPSARRDNARFKICGLPSSV